MHFLITCEILKYILKRLVVEFLTLHHLHILNAIYKQYKIRYLEKYYNYGNEVLCKTIFQYIMSKYKKKSLIELKNTIQFFIKLFTKKFMLFLKKIRFLLMRLIKHATYESHLISIIMSVTF